MLESEKITYTFGKYKGWTLKHVFDFDPSYFSWSYYSAPSFEDMIKARSQDFIKCVKITAYNERLKQSNKLLDDNTPKTEYINNPLFSLYFKEQ